MTPRDSVLPQNADDFTAAEDAMFDDLREQAELEAIVDALFPWAQAR